LDKITTVEQLLHRLSESSDEQLLSISKFLDIPAKEFESYMHFSNNCYTRNCIVKTDRYELILICWEKDQDTPIHSHGNQECWVFHVQGKIKEIRYEKDKNGIPYPIENSVLNENGIAFMNDDMGFHILKNISDGQSASLHFYVKSIEECLVYNESKKMFENKTLKFDSIGGKLID
jgi:cysteine dioxygenase